MPTKSNGIAFLNSVMYQPKFYQLWLKEKEPDETVSFEVAISESDLFISADRNLKQKSYKIQSSQPEIVKDAFSTQSHKTSNRVDPAP